MKKWYLSKTLWINLIALGSLLIRANYGFVLSPTEEGAILVVINLIMRGITKGGLEK